MFRKGSNRDRNRTPRNDVQFLEWVIGTLHGVSRSGPVAIPWVLKATDMVLVGSNLGLVFISFKSCGPCTLHVLPETLPLFSTVKKGVHRKNVSK